MARPERNNVDYFPFYCEDGNKMFYIEETYGNDGFATFIKLLRELAKTNYHYLDLSKPTTQMFLSAKCKVSKEVLLAIIDDLVELGKFDRTLWKENSIVWCQDFIDSIQDAYKKRNNECITYWGLLQLLVGLGVRKPLLNHKNDTNNPQSKVEYSKVEKTKQQSIQKIVDLHLLFISEVKANNFEEQISSLYRLLKIKKGSLTPLLEDFKNHLITEIRVHENTQSLFSNFKNWLNTLDKLGKLDQYKLKQ